MPDMVNFVNNWRGLRSAISDVLIENGLNHVL